tara:strand:+ start:8775 stop:8933 length:159 start_codon:yes stop_codon:yes gene_type:complete
MTAEDYIIEILLESEKIGKRKEVIKLAHNLLEKKSVSIRVDAFELALTIIKK